MVNLESLRTRGLRAYEAGRVRMSARIAFVLVPLAGLCLLDPRRRNACACLSILLLGLAIWLRWRDRRSAQAVTTGLLTGSLPLAAGVLLSRFDLPCGTAGGAWLCTALSALVALAAGALIAVRQARQRDRLWSCFTATAIATLAACMGCVRLGVFGVGGVVAGMVAGTAVTLLARR